MRLAWTFFVFHHHCFWIAGISLRLIRIVILAMNIHFPFSFGIANPKEWNPLIGLLRQGWNDLFEPLPRPRLPGEVALCGGRRVVTACPPEEDPSVRPIIYSHLYFQLSPSFKNPSVVRPTTDGYVPCFLNSSFQKFLISPILP